MTSFSFLRAAGDGTVILDIQRFDPVTGELETAGCFNVGEIVGVDFPLQAGEWYIVTIAPLPTRGTLTSEGEGVAIK